MPLTAYSRRFAIEMDVGQWISRVDEQPVNSLDLTNIAPRLRLSAHEDLECPSCEARGPTLVSAGVNRRGRIVSQATFRFRDSQGGDAHDPFCDFADNEKEQTSAECLIDLRSARDRITAQVRRLVCAGLETQTFTPADMRAMRLWFLDQRRSARVHLRLDPRIPPVVRELMRRSYSATVMPFEPAHGNIPGFDWGAAALERVLRPLRPLMDSLSEARLSPSNDTVTKAVQLLHVGGDAMVFDVSTLAPQFQMANQLVQFIAETYGPLRGGKQSWFNETYQEPRPALLALASLLLFVSQWNLSQAAARFACFASHNPSDETVGNLIGLNPFAHWHPVRLIKALQDSEIAIDPTFDLNAAVSVEVASLKREHAAWAATQAGMRP
jgi:hypothetical protein